jgi:hypothetical protein
MKPGKMAWRWVAVLTVLALLSEQPLSAAPPSPGGVPGEVTPLPSPVEGPPVDLRDPLSRPLESPPATPAAAEPASPYDYSPPFIVPTGVPSGFTGPSGILPTIYQSDGHFVPVEDRWRQGFPEWDRYDKGHPLLDDYPYDEGNICNPYKQNVLKGDYPIIGQHTFLNLSASSITLIEARTIPTAAIGFESTQHPGEFNFFGNPNQMIYQEFDAFTIDLFHGDAAFKPIDWRVLVMPTFGFSNISFNEIGVASPNVQSGLIRPRSFFALQEWFVEKKIADLSPNYDFVSIRIGVQPFNSDFRGFIFNDINRAVRIFGNLESNRDQFNLAFFDQLEKDTNTALNTMHNRQQTVTIANFYRQDFIWPGYTVEASMHYDHDSPSFHFDKNGFLVRPDPVGVFQPHRVDAVYLGWAGDGHINRLNINHAFYWVLGHDSMNPIAGSPQDINAKMAAVELSYDRDYVRFRTSYFYASGDGNPNNHHATGFDSILDNPNFAGTDFSYFLRQNIPLFGVNLKQRLSLVNDLRSSKIQGQANFVNPGSQIFNLGVDVDLTPKIKWFNNYNMFWFDKTATLETFVFQGNIDKFIGVDLSSGLEYRPLLNNNIIMLFGLGMFLPGKGFDDLYSNLGNRPGTLLSGFAQININF